MSQTNHTVFSITDQIIELKQERRGILKKIKPPVERESSRLIKYL